MALNAPRYADIWFEVDGKVFSSHRAIVFARCPYLRTYALLTDRFRPADASREPNSLYPSRPIPLPLMRHQVFTAVLHYLYTDHLKVCLPPCAGNCYACGGWLLTCHLAFVGSITLAERSFASGCHVPSSPLGGTLHGIQSYSYCASDVYCFYVTVMTDVRRCKLKSAVTKNLPLRPLLVSLARFTPCALH